MIKIFNEFCERYPEWIIFISVLVLAAFGVIAEIIYEQIGL